MKWALAMLFVCAAAGLNIALWIGHPDSIKYGIQTGVTVASAIVVLAFRPR